MRYTRLSPWLAMLPIILIFNYCTTEQQAYGRQAEMAYVDLLYALYTKDQADARVAAREFDLTIGQLRQSGPRFFREEEMDDMFYHLENAESVYAQARESIEDSNLSLAAVQLDRATYELSAADPNSFNELYVGSIYDFIAGWLEVDHAVRDTELCNLEWKQFTRYGKDARHLWRDARFRRPSGLIYGVEPVVDPNAFHAAHEAVGKKLKEFTEILENEDQCQAQSAAFEVTAAMWDLVLLFGNKQVTSI